MKFTLALLVAAVSAAPLAQPAANGNTLAARQSDYITDLLCAHDHLNTNPDCVARKKASGQSDISILLDPLGLSLGKSTGSSSSASASSGYGGLAALFGY